MATATYFSPASGVELPVPAVLQDTIAFAYIPTPPLFMAASPIPPKVRLYRLTLGDVAAALGAARCHRRGWTGRSIRVAMADTGFANHPFFELHGFELHGFNITRVHTPQTDHPLIDTNGHGTGESANVLVVAPDCTFFGVKHDDYSAQALETSLAQTPRIITNSWGWNIDHQTREQLRHRNPGPMPGHIMLPVPPDSELASENMPSISKGLGWGIFSETSAAAPQVAGTVALMLSANPNLSPANVREILSDTARDVERGATGLGDSARPGHDVATGAGFVDAFAACSRAFQLLNP